MLLLIKEEEIFEYAELEYAQRHATQEEEEEMLRIYKSKNVCLLLYKQQNVLCLLLYKQQNIYSNNKVIEELDIILFTKQDFYPMH